MLRRFLLLTCSLLAVSCTPASQTYLPTSYPTYNPFVPLEGSTAASSSNPNSTHVQPTRTPGPTPTRAPLSIFLPPGDPNLALATPTPDAPHQLPPPRTDMEEYVAEPGDTLGSIASTYGISLEALMKANDLADPNALSIGQELLIPPPKPGAAGPAFKIIPDSELVYGPASAGFDIEAFISSRGGYLSTYTEEVNGETLTSAQIITHAAQNYSVNPRLLLALLEYRSGWVTRLHPDPSTYDYPLGIVQLYQAGLYSQIAWAANELNRGYYLWRADAVSSWVLTDGSVVPVNRTINAGTAGIQNLFAKIDNRKVWEDDLDPSGFSQTFYSFFGNPFALAIEPMLPAQLRQPPFQLPFEVGEVWAFTGGPHAGWDAGSGWAALDFAPPNETGGCAPSPLWVTAAADGLVLRAGNGAVVQDLDNDGYEQTGWDILYMHVDSFDRVQPGTYLFAGDRIGHPSCEGGISNATHLHIARKYNGEWIPADGPLPFNLDGWVSSGTGTEYDGYLKRSSRVLEANEGLSELNQISR